MMVDLISREAATRAAVISVRDYLGNIDSERDICIEEGLYEVPAVDAASVVHGRWIYESEGMGDYSHCSECGCRVHGGRISDLSARYKFCPNCGAKMKDEGM